MLLASKELIAPQPSHQHLEMTLSPPLDAVSTLLSTAPALQVASLSRHFQPLREQLTHASAICRPPRHLPDHMTTTLEVPMPLTIEQQASVTHTWLAHISNGYTSRMLDIY